MVQSSKGAKIRNRYNQVPHLTQDTNGKVTDSQLDTTNESQEVSPFPAGDHKAHINRRVQRHSKHKTKQKDKRSTKKTLLQILPGQSRYHLMEYVPVIKDGPITIGNSQRMSSTVCENIRTFLSTDTLCLI